MDFETQRIIEEKLDDQRREDRIIASALAKNYGDDEFLYEKLNKLNLTNWVLSDEDVKEILRIYAEHDVEIQETASRILANSIKKMPELYEILQKKIAGEIIPSKKAVKICRAAKNYTKKLKFQTNTSEKRKEKRLI